MRGGGVVRDVVVCCLYVLYNNIVVELDMFVVLQEKEKRI